MNKIIRAALAAKFNPNDVDNLISIINNTPNPNMATEILLGIYECQKIPVRVNNDGVVQTLVKADEWNNTITYSYLRNKEKSAYFPKGTKKEDVTEENFNSLQVEGERDVWIRIKTSEIEEVTSTCSYEQWLKAKPICKEEEQIF